MRPGVLRLALHVGEVHRTEGLAADPPRGTAEAVATNQVGLPSAPAASAPFELILAALEPGTVWIAQRRDFGQERGAGPLGDIVIKDRSALAIGYSGATDPMDAAARFEYSWAVVEAPCDAPTSEQFAGATAQALSMHPATGQLGAALLSGHELRSGGSYCARVTACTEGSNVSATRCANTTSTPVIIDDSPPHVGARPRLAPNASGATLPLRVSVSCADDESGAFALALSLGTSAGADNLIAGLPLAAPLAASPSA